MQSHRSPIAQEQPQDENEQHDTADTTSDCRAAIVVTTATAKQQYQHDNQQNEAHDLTFQKLALTPMEPGARGA